VTKGVEPVMGLGISAWIAVGEHGKSYYEDYFLGQEQIVPHMIAPIADKDGFCVRLVSFEQDIMGIWQDDVLLIEAKTNSAGPGYHAYVCELIDGLGVAPLKVEDETGYYESRDFAALQCEMEKWVQVVGKQILDIASQGMYSNIAVSMTLDWSPMSEHFTCCPLGHFERDFFERIQGSFGFGGEFFIWWNKDRDGQFYRNAAINLMLCDINWLPPQDDFEMNAIKTALDCLDAASSLDPSLDFPVAEWVELANLSGNMGLAAIISNLNPNYGKATLGYKRGIITSSAGGWRFAHKGMMHFTVENEATIVYWDDAHTIRVTSFAVDFNEDVANKAQVLVNDLTRHDNFEDFDRIRNPEIAARIMHQHFEEDGKAMQETTLAAAYDNAAILLTVYYDDESGRGMAEAICASLAR